MWGSSAHTPNWVKDAVFYQIFPDRFARNPLVPKPTYLEAWDAPPTFHGYKGGDLLGVVEKLDYLQDLGITAIYFTPVFQSGSNHRYHTHDYYQVDPILGGNAALKTLLDEAHRRNMRVVIDGVFNHASRGFFQFHDILENGAQSPYLDWFTVYNWPLYPYDPNRQPNYAAWFGLPALPKFNTQTPAVREFLWGVGQHWVEFGVDGWRLDVPNEINDDDFWREFRRRVKGANPDAYIVGEIWHDARRWLQGDQFDAVMNYLFTRLCLGFFIGRSMDESLVQGTGLFPAPVLDARQFAQGVQELMALYHPQVTAVQLNLLDSHDTARFITTARGDASALRLATLFQMTYPGAPSIYYGDEVGKPGAKDPDSRRAMMWDDPTWWDGEMYPFFKRATALRHAHPALRHGSLTSLYAAGAVYVFQRRLAQDDQPDDHLIVAFNTSPATRVVAVDVKDHLADEAVLHNVWGGETHIVEGGTLRLRLAPRSGVVLEVQPA
jgi:cyclomaltodextrinase / maltogenic alpha-amylase / neopullulanase